MYVMENTLSHTRGLAPPSFGKSARAALSTTAPRLYSINRALRPFLVLSTHTRFPPLLLPATLIVTQDPGSTPLAFPSVHF